MFKYFEWLLPAFPLVGALLNGFLGGRLPRRVQNRIAVGAVLGSLLIALPIVIGQSIEPGLVGRPIPFHWIRVWIGSGFVEGPLSLRVDALSVVATLTGITGALFIHLHAARSITDGPTRHLVMAMLNAVLSALLALVLAGNYLFLIVGWSLTGWCTYGLFSATSTASTSSDVREQAPPHLTPVLLAASDLCLVLAVGIMSGPFSSLSLGHVVAMQPSGLANEIAPQIIATVTTLLLACATIRAAIWPAHIWIPERGSGIARATAYGLTSVMPGVYLLARSYPLIEQAPFATSILAWWGAVSALLMALPALLQPQGHRASACIAFSQGGLLLLALGTGAYPVALSFLPAFALSHILLQLTLVDAGHGKVRQGRHALRPDKTKAALGSRWIPIAALAAVGGLPFLPAFAFDAGMLAALSDRTALLWVLFMLTVALLAAGATRIVRSLLHTGRTAEAPATGGALPLAVLALVVLGLANLTSPPPLATFLQPILIDQGGQPAWWWFGSALLLVSLGAALGTALHSRLDRPAAGVLGWIAAEYRVRALSAVAARGLIAAGRFIADIVEPWVNRWTLSAVGRLLVRQARADEAGSDSVSLSVLFLLLGMAGLAAYLLFQRG